MTSTGGESEIYSQRGRQNLVHYSKGNSTNIANTILKYLGEVDNIVKSLDCKSLNHVNGYMAQVKVYARLKEIEPPST